MACMQRLGQSDPSLAHAQRWRLFTCAARRRFFVLACVRCVCVVEPCSTSTSTNEGVCVFRAVKTRERRPRARGLAPCFFHGMGTVAVCELLLSSIDPSATLSLSRPAAAASAFVLYILASTSIRTQLGVPNDRVAVFRLHGHTVCFTITASLAACCWLICSLPILKHVAVAARCFWLATRHDGSG
jgi:hypothetical protein